MLAPEYSGFAIAKISKENSLFKPIRSICLALVNINDGRQAWASVKFSDYIGGNISIMHCPAKKGDGISYAYNAELTTGNALTKLRALENQNLPIICDSDQDTFQAPGGNISGAAFRHGRKLIATNDIAIAIGTNGPVQVTPDNANYQHGKKLGWIKKGKVK